jgi:hypothetical protein
VSLSLAAAAVCLVASQVVTTIMYGSGPASFHDKALFLASNVAVVDIALLALAAVGVGCVLRRDHDRSQQSRLAIARWLSIAIAVCVIAAAIYDIWWAFTFELDNFGPSTYGGAGFATVNETGWKIRFALMLHAAAPALIAVATLGLARVARAGTSDGAAQLA